MELLGKILLSRYKVEKVLGSGGFGDTYLAKDIALPMSPYCVVKHLKPKHDSEDVKAIALSLFEREAHMLYELGEHDSIPRLFAHFEQKGEFFLVQEFIDGHDLSQELIPGKPWSSAQVTKLLHDLLSILAILHARQVIHRDVKPQNVMRCDDSGKLCLIDFGAVKEIPQLTLTEAGQTALTVAIGSPGYMPSEQAIGKPKAASDLYAVGMIAIQALTGQAPTQLLQDQTTGDWIWQSVTPISEHLDAFVRRLTRDHFSQRYMDATEALEALNVIMQLNNQGTTIQPALPEVESRDPLAEPVPPTEYQGYLPDSLRSRNQRPVLRMLPWFIAAGSLLALGLGALIVIAPWEGTVTITKDGRSLSSPDSTVDINVNRSYETPLPSVSSPGQFPSPIEIQKSKGFSISSLSTELNSANSDAATGRPWVIDPPSNIRVTPNGAILCSVPQPQPIEVGKPTGEWYATSFCGELGFIHRSQLSFESLAALVFDPPSNVRAQPNGIILCAVNQRRRIQTLGEQSGWYLTNACGQSSIGYIHHSQILLDP